MRYIIVIGLFVFASCGGQHRTYDEHMNEGISLDYVALSVEYLDGVGFSFYDKKQVLYFGDSTFIIYPDSNDLVFYHLESKQEISRLTFSVFVENCKDFSVETPQDAAVWYGNSIAIQKNGLETFYEIGEEIDGYFWHPFNGFEYFSNLDKVVLGVSCGSWPGVNRLDFCLAGLAEYDLQSKEIRLLPFKYSEIYRDSLFWGTEMYTTKSGSKLVVSENWSQNVYAIDMETYTINEFKVNHSDEKLDKDLPKDLIDYPQFAPGPEEQKTEKNALWELRHFYFEKYGQAFLGSDGNSIYRVYYHRIPLSFADYKTEAHFKHLKAITLIQCDMRTGKIKEFPLFAGHFFVPNGFWMGPDDKLDHIKFLYRRDRDVENAIYLFERIEQLSI